MSSFAHIDNKKKDILVIVKRPTQGLEHTLTAGKMYSIDFTVTKKKFCLSFHYNGTNSYLFVNGTKIIKFKAKDSEITMEQIVICLWMVQKLLNSKQKILNISKDWSVDNMKKTGFTGYLYDFSVDYNSIAVDNIKDFHKYLMEKIT